MEAEAIERAYHLDHTTELLILPYTTDKGNFSLKVKREAKIVKFDEIQLKAEEIMISGYAGYLSSENQLSVKTCNLSLKRGEDPVEKHFPIKMTKKRRILNSFGKMHSPLKFLISK